MTERDSSNEWKEKKISRYSRELVINFLYEWYVQSLRRNSQDLQRAEFNSLANQSCLIHEIALDIGILSIDAIYHRCDLT